MEIGNKTIGSLLFLAGVVVGLKYPKIKQKVQPVVKSIGKHSRDGYKALSKYLAEWKEKATSTHLPNAKKRIHGLLAKVEETPTSAEPQPASGTLPA
ncbi:MAG: hypothetical protein KKC28_14865 [Verrucomicrobia bacterium]|nr:hypothetical protein [Verrucomicrobiota bacterium]